MNEKTQAQTLFNFMEKHGLTQVISEPTRGENILHLVMTNNEDLLHQMLVQDTNASDHRIVKTVLRCRDAALTKDKQLVDFEALNFHRAVDWAQSVIY